MAAALIKSMLLGCRRSERFLQVVQKGQGSKTKNEMTSQIWMHLAIFFGYLQETIALPL